MCLCPKTLAVSLFSHPPPPPHFCIFDLHSFIPILLGLLSYRGPYRCSPVASIIAAPNKKNKHSLAASDFSERFFVGNRQQQLSCLNSKTAYNKANTLQNELSLLANEQQQ